MNKEMFRKIWSFGSYWWSLMIIFMTMFFGAQKVVSYTTPIYTFHPFWKSFDMIGILMILTAIISFVFIKQVPATREALSKIWHFCGYWASCMFIFGAVFFFVKWYTVQLNSSYVFSNFWHWDVIGIMMLFTCVFSFLLTRKPHAAKKQ